MARKIRLQVYLDPDDLEYIRALREVAGLENDSHAVRFAIKLLRMVLPNAQLFVSCVLRYLNSEEEAEGYSG